MAMIEKQTASTIYANLGQLSNEMVSLQQPKQSPVMQQYALYEAKYSEYSRQDLFQLAEALIADNPTQFARYVTWLYSMLTSHKVPEHFVELNLETARSVLEKTLPREEYAVAFRFLQKARHELKEPNISNRSFLSADETLSPLATQYLNTLLEGDRGKAHELIMNAIESGVSIQDIYLKVFNPCLYEVGRLWQTDKITVAHEHFFSAATQLIMSELYPSINKNSGKTGRVAIAACVAGELHEIGLRMVADILELGGWRTYYLGASMPELSIIEMINEKKAQLLVLSCCLPINGPALRELIATVRHKAGNNVKIIIGGYTISSDPVYAASFGADGTASDAGGVLNLANSLFTR
jgi:methanogenic corrinoid protein MtbC1